MRIRTWEHTTWGIEELNTVTEAELREYGRDGWQLIAVLKDVPSDYYPSKQNITFFFSREIIPEDAG